MEQQDWFALGLLLSFLAGWFVCWIQMSNSKSEYLPGEMYESLLELWKSDYRQLQSEYQTLKESQSLPPLQFESQQWKSQYPEPQIEKSGYQMAQELVVKWEQFHRNNEENHQ